MGNVNTNIRMAGTEQESVYVVNILASGAAKGTRPYSTRLERILNSKLEQYIGTLGGSGL